MSRELIMFIAYKTTEDLAGTKRGRFNHFGRAKVLITFAVAINVVEIVLVANSLFFKERLDFTDGKFFLLYLLPLLVYFLVNVIFKKNTLAKSIKSYKDSKVAEVGRAIGLSYLFLNFAIVIFLIYIMRFYE
ncbi:hypothetical protein [Niastella populi]|uniref:Uncharacterized protein n=1 Tax=Niastella populi TaxID=550983 RepID=A0A1V9FDR2_9BACT|nr:hypothetical protein [Niastella populi]OQP56421.1 hypothetical protein A4R26_04470 [Niastella populi]